MMESEKNNTKTTLDYSTDFPKLPDAPSATSTSSSLPTGVWNGPVQPTIKSSVITEAFKLSAEERASRGFGKAFGTVSEEQQKCNQIAQLTGTKIELNEAKDQSITILITGKEKNVEEARTRLVRELQTQATIRLEIPKDYHSFLIGKQGMKLRQLEQKFLCRIHMPNREEKSDVIRIVGPNEYIVEAAKHIKAIGDEMARQKTENLDIPRSFYPWIRGVNNEKVEELMRRTGAKVNIPPNHANNETIIITGEREGVESAAEEINAIYQEKKELVVSVEITVKKPQHRFIIGRKRMGLDDIFRETEVIVELPPEDSDSETIVLRGPKDKIGDAVGAVYQRASSTIATELAYQEWMRRHLIGPKGQNLQSLVPNQDKLKIDFDDGIIYIEGPPEQVKQAQSKLSAEISRLGDEYCSDVMHVAPNLHRHVIGRSGALVNKLKEEFDVQISVPNESSHSDQIRLEGKKENVEKVREAIADIVTKQEKKTQEEDEKRKKAATEAATADGSGKASNGPVPAEEPHVNAQMEVDPRFHRHFIVRGAEVLREIQAQCGHCQISFPKQETGDKIVSIRGPKSGVEAAKKRILQVVADLESQMQIQVEVDPKHHRHFIIKGAEVLREIQTQSGNCQISFPKQDTNESMVTIKGRKDNVEMAKKRILDIVVELESLVQEQLEVDPKHHRHFIVRGAEVLKDIQTQCGNCQISFPKQETGESIVTLKGHKDHVEAAKKQIMDIVAELESMTQIQFEVDPKHHRHFIVRSAEVLKEIQTQCGNCQISFPKPDSTDKFVTVKGPKEKAEAAQKRILDIVADLESLTHVPLKLDQRFHPRLIGQRGRNLRKVEEEYGVQIDMPNRNSAEPDIVTVTGKDEQKVLDCVDRLRSMEEDFIGDLTDRNQYMAPRHEPPPPKPKAQNIEITGAPWQLDSLEQFPTIGASPTSNTNNNQQPKPVSAAAWGQRR